MGGNHPGSHLGGRSGDGARLLLRAADADGAHRAVRPGGGGSGAGKPDEIGVRHRALDRSEEHHDLPGATHRKGPTCGDCAACATRHRRRCVRDTLHHRDKLPAHVHGQSRGRESRRITHERVQGAPAPRGNEGRRLMHDHRAQQHILSAADSEAQHEHGRWRGETHAPSNLHVALPHGRPRREASPQGMTDAARSLRHWRLVA